MYSKNIIYELERRGVLRRVSWGMYTVDAEKLGQILSEVE
jgi:predicted transcriptional regulator of viral defense system